MTESAAGEPAPGTRQSPIVKGLIGVVGIALLGAGLFWGMTEARDAATERPRTAACQENLRRIGQAVQMYAQDNDGTLPISATGHGDITGLLQPYTHQKYGQGIWRCPGQIPFASGIWTSSYGYNWQYLLKPGPDYPHNDWNGLENPALKLSEIARPAGTVMFIDQKPPPGNPSANLWSYVLRPSQKIKDPYSFDGMGIPDFRHRWQANTLWCDGHVSLMDHAIGVAANEGKYWNPR